MKSDAFGSISTDSPTSRVAAPGLVCSCDITLAAPSQCATSATRNASRESAANQTSVRQAAAVAARSESGRNDVQIAARPEPTATADPPRAPQSRTVQARVRASDGEVAGVVARWWVSTATST